MRDYSHGETLGNGVKWEYFPARGARELGHLYTSSWSPWSSRDEASLPPLRVCTPAVASGPSHRRGRRQGEKSPQIELGTSNRKVGTPKVRGMHMSRCHSSSDKFTTTWGLRRRGEMPVGLPGNACWLRGKESECSAGGQLQCRRRRFHSLGQEGPLEQGTATHSSILAWRIPWMEEPGGL